MVAWHHRLNGHEFGQTPGDNERQGSLAYCSLWGPKELDMTERLNNKSEKHQLCWRGSLTPEGKLQMWLRRAGEGLERGAVHSQREPIPHCVDSMEAAPVQWSVHRIVADPGQRFQGTGRERRGRIPNRDGGRQSGHSDPSSTTGLLQPQATPATCLPACPSPHGGWGAHPGRKQGTHSPTGSTKSLSFLSAV